MTARPPLDIVDQVVYVPIATTNVETLAEHGVIGEAWTLSPHPLDRRL